MTKPKPQPLEDKTIAIIQTDPWDEGGKFPRGFLKKDVKAAVEWLKEQLSDYGSISMETLDNIIDQAFDDAIKRKRLY